MTSGLLDTQPPVRASAAYKAFSGSNTSPHSRSRPQRLRKQALPRQATRKAPRAPATQTSKRQSKRGLQTVQALSSGWEVASDSGSKGVRVFQMDQHQSKRIFAEVKVHASVDQVWRVITDYDHLADFVPNLVSSKRIPSSKPGVIHLRQLGCSQSVFWRLEAEAVLECVEVQRVMGARELRFKAIEGDFKEYSGSWVVEPDPAAHTSTLLKYEISLQPKLSIPSAIVTCVVKAGLPANMMAMAKQAEQVAELKRKFPRFAASALAEEEPSLPWQSAANFHQEEVEQLPEAGPSRPIWDHIRPSRPQQSARSGFLGMASVLIPRLPVLEAAQPQDAIAHRPHTSIPPALVTGTNEGSPVTPTQRIWKGASTNLHSDSEHTGGWGRSPDLGVGWKRISDASAVTEVHLRRLDSADTLHRRVVAVLTVDATPEEVWEVLTDYEELPEVVPNLAVCEQIKTPSGMSSRVTRLRQVGYKHMLYMCMHAEAIVDLVEKEHQEVQFRQVQGDFSVLQGKFMLQKGPTEKQLLNGYWVSKPQTHLKYAVEVQIARDPLRLLGLVEPIIERMVYEDLPLNLGAIKARVEDNKQRAKLEELEQQGEVRRAAVLRRRLETPPVDVLQTDFTALQAELERFYGSHQRMPTRPELRAANRSHLERAIAAHGGFGAVAARLGWNMAYNPKRPRGYWNSIMNVKAEVDEFIKANGLPPGLVPTLRDVRKADRCDLARAIEKWGGPSQVAEELAYKVASRLSRPTKSLAPKDAVDPPPEDKRSNTIRDAVQISDSAADKLGRHVVNTRSRSQHKQQQHDSAQSDNSVQQSRGKAPSTASKRLISSKRRDAKLPGMRQEIDRW